MRGESICEYGHAADVRQADGTCDCCAIWWALGGAGEPRLDPSVRFEDDPLARLLVLRNGALTGQTVGALLGISRERVRQITETAMDKLAQAIPRRGQNRRDRARHRRVSGERARSRAYGLREDLG